MTCATRRILVELYELFCEGSTWFFTMELIRGVGLLEYLQHEPRPARQSHSGSLQHRPSPAGGASGWRKVSRIARARAFFTATSSPATCWSRAMAGFVCWISAWSAKAIAAPSTASRWPALLLTWRRKSWPANQREKPAIGTASALSCIWRRSAVFPQDRVRRSPRAAAFPADIARASAPISAPISCSPNGETVRVRFRR